MAVDRCVIGTRGSDLALWQAQWVQSELQRLFPSLIIDLRVIRTTGDKISEPPLPAIGTTGIFTKEIEEALFDKRADIAVHSLKDIPTVIPGGLSLAAVTRREDTRDAFIAHPKKEYHALKDLPQGATVATGSLRRKCQILNRRPDIKIVDLRGNILTRFRKLEESDWDGMLLASAGIHRLGLQSDISFLFEPIVLLPAVGQGALGIEIRTGDERTLRYVEALNHLPTAQAVSAERALLHRLEGGCHVPIGAYGRILDGILKLDAVVGSPDGTSLVRDSVSGNAGESESLGRSLAEKLLENGARQILDNLRKA